MKRFIYRLEAFGGSFGGSHACAALIFHHFDRVLLSIGMIPASVSGPKGSNRVAAPDFAESSLTRWPRRKNSREKELRKVSLRLKTS